MGIFDRLRGGNAEERAARKAAHDRWWAEEMQPHIDAANNRAAEPMNPADAFAAAREGLADLMPERRVDTEDPAERARIAAAERAAREAALRPYVAPEPPAVAVTRVMVRPGHQLEDLAVALDAMGLSARPDLVHGVFRVPDRIANDGVVVNWTSNEPIEWGVVHHPGALDPSARSVATTAFARETRLVARADGDPAVTDEDVAAEFITRARIEPHLCFGAARLVRFEDKSVEGSTSWEARVDGIATLYSPNDRADAAREAMVAEAPLDLPAAPAAPFHIEVLDWTAIGPLVQPDIGRGPLLPSPRPELPADPEELLLAYLAVVGVRARDSWSAQVTASAVVYEPPVEGAGWSVVVGGGTKFPCADGVERARVFGAERVVLAYRDSEEYAAGRARWKAFQDEVLGVTLDARTGVRPAIAKRDDGGVFDRAADIAAFVLLDFALAGKQPPYPYCWPLVER